MQNDWLSRAAGMGALAGLRSVGPVALLSMWLAKRALKRETGPTLPPPLDLLAHPGAARLLGLMALNEMVLDKLPFIGPRTAPPTLALRVVSGMLVGGVVASRDAAPPYEEAPLSRDRALKGAVAGGLAAVGAAYLAVALRKWIPKLLHVPSPLVGLGEDFVVITAGSTLLGEDFIELLP